MRALASPAAPEFSRLVDVSRIGHLAHRLTIEANAQEREALARRFGLLSLDRLVADLTIERRGERGLIEVSGRFMARLQQSCVVTLEPVPAAIDRPIRAFYGGDLPVGGAEIDPTAVDDDAEPLQDGAIDCGEAVAQQLAIELEPYPRAPGAVLPAGASRDPE